MRTSLLGGASLLHPPGSGLFDPLNAASKAEAAAIAYAGAALVNVNPTSTVGTETFSNGSGVRPGWLSADGTILFNYQLSILKDSTDGGTTWRTLHTFPNTVIGVRQMPNEELLVGTIFNPDGSAPGQMFVSTGYPTLGASATWTATLTMDVLANAVDWYSYSPPLHHMDNLPAGVNMGIVLVGEYGGLNLAPNQSHKVYLSENYGVTWRVIYDDPTTHNSANFHMHGTAYDPYGDLMWVSTGDGIGNEILRYSSDWRKTTPTWTDINISPTHQVTGIWPLPDCVLFGADNAPNGVRRVDRLLAGGFGPLTQAYALDASGVLTHTTRLMYKRPTGPLIFSFSATRNVAGADRGYIVATWNGRDYFPLWQEPTPYVDTTYPVGEYGVYTALGPTAQNTYVCDLQDDSRGFSHTFMKFPRPTWQQLTVGTAVALAGAAPPWPSHVPIPVLSTPVAQTTWNSAPIVGSSRWYGGTTQSTAQNSSRSYDVPLHAGTWTLDMLHFTGTANGIYTIAIDGVTVGTIDGYAASGAAKSDTLTGIVVASSGLHRVSFTMATHNASSTGYSAQLSAVSMTRTA